MDNFMLKRALPYYEQIYQSIKELVYQGVYNPGDRIYEVQIAKQFNVSRSPVREAVRVLVKEGLLTIDDKSQIRVYKPSIKDVENIYQCRTALESLAVELTTEKASDNNLQVIENVIIKTEKALDGKAGKDKHDIISLNGQFHDLIVHYCGNNRLQKHLIDLRSLTYYYRAINFEGENRKEIILDEHQKIFTQMKNRSAYQASELMKIHMVNDLNHLKSIVKD